MKEKTNTCACGELIQTTSLTCRKCNFRLHMKRTRERLRHGTTKHAKVTGRDDVPIGSPSGEKTIMVDEHLSSATSTAETTTNAGN